MPTGLLTDLYGRNLRYTYKETDTVQQVYTTIQTLIKLQNFNLVYKGWTIPRDLTPITEYPGLDNYPICVVPENRARSLGFWSLPSPAASIRPAGGQRVTIRWRDGVIGQYSLSRKLEIFSGEELYPELENLGIFLKPGDITVDGKRLLTIGSIDQQNMYSYSFDDYLLEVTDFTYSQALSGVAVSTKRKQKRQDSSGSFEESGSSSLSGSRSSRSESTSDFEATLIESGSESSDSDDIVVPKIKKQPVKQDESDEENSYESEEGDDSSLSDSRSDDSEDDIDKIKIKVQGLNTLITVYETNVPVGGDLTATDVYRAVRQKMRVNDRQISFHGRRLSETDKAKLRFNPVTDIFRIEPNVVVSNRYGKAASSVR